MSMALVVSLCVGAFACGSFMTSLSSRTCIVEERVTKLEKTDESVAQTLKELKDIQRNSQERLNWLEKNGE